MEPVISKGKLVKGQMKDWVVLVTGAGGGIGYETARALLWLGAQVAIAEIDEAKGGEAEKRLHAEFGKANCAFIRCDIGDEASVRELAKAIQKRYGRVDAVLNNATIAPVGAAHTVGIETWDRSYSVNLRGPVLLLQAFLPGMLERKKGVIAFVPSSGAAPFMAAYESFKTAQVELCNSLAGEIANTGVVTYAIGPGIVKTETAVTQIRKIAPLMEKSEEEFYRMTENVHISAEEAGAGFAASIANAHLYNGMEISSIQALMDAGIQIQPTTANEKQVMQGDTGELSALFKNVIATYLEQKAGWLSRNVFEKQWILRDFKKETGLSVEQMENALKAIGDSLEGGMDPGKWEDLPLSNLKKYYLHQRGMVEGYEKNKEKAKESMAVIDTWVEAIDAFEKKYNV